MFGDARSRFGLTRRARRELRAVLARDDDGRRGGRIELFRIEMTAARQAVDVPVLVLVITRVLGLLLALGEGFLTLDHREGGSVAALIGGAKRPPPEAAARAASQKLLLLELSEQGSGALVTGAVDKRLRDEHLRLARIALLQRHDGEVVVRLRLFFG